MFVAVIVEPPLDNCYLPCRFKHLLNAVQLSFAVVSSWLQTFRAGAAASQGHLENELLSRFINILQPQTIDGHVGRLTGHGVDGVRAEPSESISWRITAEHGASGGKILLHRPTATSHQSLSTIITSIGIGDRG